MEDGARGTALQAAVRRYIQEQEKEDQRLDQLTLMPL